MTSNHDQNIVNLFHSALEDIMDHFLKFPTFDGAQHFLGLFATPPLLYQPCLYPELSRSFGPRFGRISKIRPFLMIGYFLSWLQY